MGQYIGRNKLGTPALFIIKGDTPDPGEMAKIADILSGKGVQAEAPAPAPEEEPGILENIKGNVLRGWNETQAGVDVAMQGLKEAQGDTQGAREWGDAARDQLAERDTYKVREKGFLEEEGIYNKIASLTGTTARTGIGVAGSIGATIAGGAIGTAVGGPVGAVVGTGLGLAASTAAYAPQMLSANAERQIEEHGYIKDFGKAFKATALQAATNAITDKITLKLGGIAYKGAKSAAKAAGFSGRAVTDPAIHEAVDKSIKKALTEAAKRIGVPAAFGAVSGAAEEVMQQQLERWQAELPLMDDDAKKEYLESAIVGGILEGVFGAGAGYIGHRQDTKTIKRMKAAAADVESETAARIQRATGSAAEHERLRQSRYEEPPPPPPPDGSAGRTETPLEESKRLSTGALPDFSAETREQIALRNLPPGLNEDETGAPPPPPSGPSFTNPLPDNFPAFEGERDVDNDSFRKALLKYGKTPNRQEAINIFRDTEETRRAHKAQQSTKQEPVQGPTKPIYSETEYRDSIDKLRDFKSLSVDRIATEMKMPRPKAQAVFAEMLRRNDAYPAGNQNQYAKITVPRGLPTRSGLDVRGVISPRVSRDFIVKPVRRADQLAFGVEVAGKARKPRFATHEEAEAWITKNIPKSKQAQVVEDASGQQFGIHELHYRHMPAKGAKGSEQHLIGERVVNTFQTKEEADEAIKEYDPAYSPETNQRRTRMPVEEKESAIAADTLVELGPIEHQLQNAVNATVGAGRAQVDLVPKITRDYLRKLFPDVHNSRIPGEDAVVEGLHHTDPRALIKNVITLGADLNSPSLTEEQRTQLIQEVLNHELIHLIRSLNLLTNQEWNQLYKAALNQNIPGKEYTWAERAFIMQGPKSSTNAVMEEAVAEMFRTYVKDPTTFRNPERGILKKIADLIKKLIGLGKRHDAEDLMDMISNGGIADREIGHGGSRPGHEQEDIFYSLLKPDNFYLKTAQFIDGIKQAKAPAQQWKGMLKNAGIRQDEKEWLGLDEWLDSIAKDGPVDKHDIQNFIGASSGIEVKVYAHRSNKDLAAGSAGRPEWGSMQSSGGEDYAEAVFIFRPKLGEPSYEGSHYSEDNVVAHARFKTIRDENGKKILFVEEIQSDLHQGADKAGGYYSESLKEAKEQAEREWREKDFISKNLFNKRTEAGHKLAVKREKLRQVDKQLYAYKVNGALPPWGEPDPVPILKQDRERLEDEIVALQGEFGRIDNVYKAAYDEANAKFKVIDKIRTRMWIPNAPFKTSWEDYVIKRMIRHAIEHGFDGIAWHGQPESVAETEKYPDFVTEEYESGPKYFVGKRDPESNEETRPNVTSIVNRYIQKLPRIVKKLAARFGADIELNEASPDVAGPVKAKGSTAYIPPLLEYKYQIEAHFPSKQSLKSLYNKMKARQERELGFGHHTQAAEDQQNKLIDGIRHAYQIALNQRTFDPVKAFEDAGLIFENSNEADAYESDMLRDMLIWTQPNATWADVNEARRGDVLGRAGVKPTSKGAFPWKHYQLNFNQPMKEAFEKGDIPKFSVLEPPKYSATAPLGQRVPPNPPIDRLSEMHNRMTYDNLAPQIHKIFAMLPGEQREAAKSFTDTSIINMQDRMLSIGRIIDQLKKNGGVITTENDTYLRQTLFASQTDAHLTANEKAFYQPLENAIKGLSVTQADYNALITHFGADSPVGKILKTYPKVPKFALAELYLYAQHAQERNAEMRRRNAVWQRDANGRIVRDPQGNPVPVRPMAYEEGSGMSDPLAQQVLNWFNGTPARMREFSDLTNPNSVRSRMRALITSTNDVRVEGGLNPNFRTMRYTDGSRVDPYDDYVPLRGMIAEAHDEHDEVTESFAKTGSGFNIRGKEDYAAVGREEHLARDIISTAMMQNQEAIVRAGKNKVGQSFLKLIQDNPTEMARVAEIMQMPKTKYVYKRKLAKVVQETDNTVHQDPNVLKVKVEGNQVYIKMKDARVVQALGDKSGLGNAGIGPLMKALLGLNRWMASMRTSYNPEFLINNFVKDFGAGLANLSEYEMAGLRREVGSSVFPALRGIRRALRSGDTTSEWAKVHEEYRLHGGHTAFYGIRELDDTIQRINKEFSADMSGPAGKVKKTLQSLVKLVEDYNLVIENGTRLATYKALRDRYLAMSGDPNNAQNQKRAKEMAAFAAKNLTVNFNMGGEWKNNLNVFYLFYNASLQGSMALLNPLIRSGKLRRAWMGIVGIGVLQDVIMSMLSPEDDNGEKLYDKLSEVDDGFLVEHNAIFLDPFGITERGYFKLPLPYMLNSVYNIGRMASKMARGKATLGEFMSSAGMSFIESTNPLGGMNTFANWVAPTLLDPFIDLTINEKFTGTPIMPAENPFGRSEVRSQRYWNNTNPAYVSIADWMSARTGRESDYIGGAVEVSPNQIDYAVDFLFGGVGPFLTRSVWFAGGAVDPAWREEMSATDIPFVRKLYGSITSKNDQQRYMKGKDQVLRVLDSLKAARKDGDNEAYMEIMRNHPAEYKAAARINTIENARRRVSSQIKKVRDSKKLTEEKKTELIKAYKEKQDMLVGKGNEVLTGID